MTSNWSYSPETPNLGQNRWFFSLCDLEIWQMNLKNNRAPLLSNIKLCASYHCHMWIQNGVTVRKWLNEVMTLTFNLWPWPFAWTSLLSIVITPKNFMMIRWEEHSEKGVTDRQTDGRTERSVLRAAWSQLKILSGNTEKGNFDRDIWTVWQHCCSWCFQKRKFKNRDSSCSCGEDLKWSTTNACNYQDAQKLYQVLLYYWI